MAKNKKLSDIEKHQRINDILLGSLERPAINWLVRRLPEWVTPDHLTFLGLAASILTGVSYWLTNHNPAFLWLASLGFILNWFGDSLDGNLARFRKIERPKYGFFIDHTMDTISEVIIFLSLGLSPYVNFSLACLALIGYLCMANLVYITTSVAGVFRISYGSLGPTEVRVIAILSNTVLFFMGVPTVTLPGLPPLSYYDLVVIFVTLLLFFFFVFTTATQAVQFERLDRKTQQEKTGLDRTRKPE
jgi:archaetidylinositol phosphate synthase